MTSDLVNGCIFKTMNQGRYIINAFLILFIAGITVFFLSKFINSEAKTDNIIHSYSDTTSLKITNTKGKQLFQNNCASCHSIFKDMTGPALTGLEKRGPWSDRKKLYEWINNPPKFMMGNEYARGLKERFGVIMTGFSLSEKDIDAIVDYINSSQLQETMPVALK